MTPLFLENLLKTENRTVILASQSPRRIELLESAGLRFSSIPADVDENPTHFRDSVDFAEQNALAKARRVGEEHRADLIIGSDTVVVLDDHIMGKPVDREDAAEMLGKLSGREHQVVSALALLFPGQTVVESEITRVRFAPLSGREISAYLDTLEPFDKAGAYGIQGFAGLFIAGISGDYYNVIGFPLHRFYQCLKREWGV